MKEYLIEIENWNKQVEEELPNWRYGWKVLIFLSGAICYSPLYWFYRIIKFIFKK